MRIVLVVPQFPKVSETFIFAKAAALLERGCDLHVVCDRSDDAQWTAFAPGPEHRELRQRVHIQPPKGWRPKSLLAMARHGLHLLRLPPRVTRRYLEDRTSPWHSRLRNLWNDGVILRLSPDIVHVEFGSLAPERLRLRCLADCAVTVSFRGYDLNYVGLEVQDFYRPVWDHADGIHVLSDDLWRRAVRRGAPPDRSHHRIAPAVATEKVVGRPPRPGSLGTMDAAIRVLSVGRLHWKKGYDYALEAVADLQRRGLVVEHRIIGDGDRLEAVAFWRHQLGLDDVVDLLGSVAPGEVAQHYQWADVLLHAATSEGFCNAVLEAQAHGVPVVCTDADGLRENVEHGVTGLVVPRRDAAALADAVERLARDPQLRVAMASAGPLRVERSFRLEDQIDAWEAFYAEAVGRQRHTSDGAGRPR